MMLTIPEIIQIVKGIPTIKCELPDNRSWGDCSSLSKQMIDPDTLIYVLKTIKSKRRKK